MADKHSTLKGLLLLLALPAIAAWCFLVYVPFCIVRHVFRWYQMPQWKRDSINARSRAEKEHAYEQVEAAIRAELLAHRLMDTPQNRTRINSTMQRRRK